MVVSVTLRLSAGLLRWIQRLDRSQLAHPFFTHAILRLPALAFFAKVGVKDAERLPHSYFFWVRSAV